MYCQNCGQQIDEGAKFCRNCGSPVAPSVRQSTQPVLTRSMPQAEPTIVEPNINVHVINHEPEKIHNFGVWKLVSGILSICFFLVVILQSCAVGVYNALGEAEDAGSFLGLFVALLMLVIGIVSIAGRKSRGANIAIIILCFIGAVIGFKYDGVYSDLEMWAYWISIVGVLALLAYILYQPKKT